MLSTHIWLQRYERRIKTIDRMIKLKEDDEDASDLEIWEWLKSLFETLGVEGVSSDESEVDEATGDEVYYVKTCYDRDNRLRSRTLSIVREVGSGLYLNKQNASDEVLSVLE